jgi:hypothetical protein
MAAIPGRRTEDTMTRWAILAIPALCLSALTACGSSPGPGTFMSATASGVVFIQWQTGPGNSVQGMMTDDTLSGAVPDETVSTGRAPFTGAINGSSVSLTFKVLFASGTVYGTLNGATLTLQIPQTGGQFQPGTLTAAGVAAYNKAVAQLQTHVNQDNQTAAQQQAQAQQQAHAQQSQAAQQGQAEAETQDAANKAADAKANAACASFGGDWTDPGSGSFTASNGLVFDITSGPENASCDNVPYLGTDDSTYRISVQFSNDGTPQYIGPAASVTGATRSECQRGYYPDQSAGQTSQPPGIWSSVLGLCVPPS